MSAGMEIYACRWGKKLEDGVLRVSDQIHNRDEAIDDAEELCHQDDSIHRIAYYLVNDAGDFRLFHTFVNDGAIPPDGYYKPLPDGVTPTVFMPKAAWFEIAWREFKALF
ncbi:MAG: hypothetical protein VX741_01160 [Pseudomonadota bacterium]|nr:hypothetical protein [Pseudomonadota bacterium]